MRADTSIECLTPVANAIDRALSVATARGVDSVAALLSRMSREIEEHRHTLDGFPALGRELAPFGADRPFDGTDVEDADVGDDDASDDDSRIETVPNDTRWNFGCAGFRFRVCAFRVLSNEGEAEVPVTLLWQDAAGGRGRVQCTDVQAAFRHAAQLIATATLWSRIGE